MLCSSKELTEQIDGGVFILLTEWTEKVEKAYDNILINLKGCSRKRNMCIFLFTVPVSRLT